MNNETEVRHWRLEWECNSCRQTNVQLTHIPQTLVWPRLQHTLAQDRPLRCGHESCRAYADRAAVRWRIQQEETS